MFWYPILKDDVNFTSRFQLLLIRVFMTFKIIKILEWSAEEDVVKGSQCRRIGIWKNKTRYSRIFTY